MFNHYFTRNKTLTLFFLFTLSWTWLCGLIPILLGNIETPLGSFIFYFGGGAPSVVGLLIVCLTYSKQNRRDYFSRCFSLRKMGWKWPLWSFCVFSIIAIVGIFISTNLLGHVMPGLSWLKSICQKSYTLPVFLFLSYLSGPINEEFGWRGYSLDHLLVRFGWIKANLILGTIWTIWHLFWYMNPQQSQYEWLQRSLFDALIYLPATILLCFVVCIVYIKTNRSILAGATVHMLRNLLSSQLLSPISVEVSTVLKLVEIGVYLIITIYFIRSTTFKKQLETSIREIKAQYY